MVTRGRTAAVLRAQKKQGKRRSVYCSRGKSSEFAPFESDSFAPAIGKIDNIVVFKKTEGMIARAQKFTPSPLAALLEII